MVGGREQFMREGTLLPSILGHRGRLGPFPARIRVERLDSFGNRPRVLAKVLLEHLAILADHKRLHSRRAVSGGVREDGKAADHLAANNICVRATLGVLALPREDPREVVSY